MVALKLRVSGVASQIGQGMLVTADKLPNPGVKSYGFLFREFNASPHVLQVGVESDLINWTNIGAEKLFSEDLGDGELVLPFRGDYEVSVTLTVQTTGVIGFFGGFITKNNVALPGSRFTVTAQPNTTHPVVVRGVYSGLAGDILRVRLNGLANATVTFPHGQFVATQAS